MKGFFKDKLTTDKEFSNKLTELGLIQLSP